MNRDNTMMPISITTGQAQSSFAGIPHQTRPPPPSSSSPPTVFRLRPRSNSHPVADEVGLGPAAIPFQPRQPHAIHTISPDGPVHASLSKECHQSPSKSPTKAPPPSFASFFAKPSASCSSPIKKQKTDRNRLRLSRSPDSSPSDKSDGSHEQSSSEVESPQVTARSDAMFSPSFSRFPSTPPTTKNAQDAPPSTGKRPLPLDDEENNTSPDSGEPSQARASGQPEPSSPFTPRGRALLRNLCIHSPSASLSSMSPTPGNTSSSRARIQVIDAPLPALPTFTLSPSLKLEKDCIFPNARESTSRSTPLGTPSGTPKRAPRGSATISSANSSPFHSLRGLHPGSSFKALPPRLYPIGREDGSTASVASYACPSPTSTKASSKLSTSSPRMVPLTVLSRNGSPAISPMKGTPNVPPFELSALDRSPLMRSLDFNKEDSAGDLLSLRAPRLEDAKVSGNVEDSPMSGEASLRLLPRIKLTPRGKHAFASSKLDQSPGDASDGLSMPALSGRSGLGMRPSPERERYGQNVQPASSFVTDASGDKEAAEMDSLLSGFGHHQTPARGTENGSSNRGLNERGSARRSMEDNLGRVESEEAEIVSLTQGPFLKASWLPPFPATHERQRRSSLICSDDEDSHCYSHKNDRKPMPSITLNLATSSAGEAPCSASPSFLPPPVPAQTKCRSLFSPLKNAEDPLQSIIRADAIAEAAKSNEPLTDDDSVDGESADFLLCLPQASQEKENRRRDSFEEKQPPVRSDPAGFRSESPSFNRRAESPLFNSGSFTRRRRRSDHNMHGLSSPTTPTILEEGSTVPQLTCFGSENFGRFAPAEGLGRRKASDGTFTTLCSLSDCDASDTISSPKYSRAKTLGATRDRPSTCSLLSTSSLCGLDIVHEGSMGSAEGAVDRVPVLLPSGSSDFSIPMFKPMRSELSMNSLGLSVDSTSEEVGRDLYTPVAMGAPCTKQTLSPPPLQCRAASPLPFDVPRWK